MISPAITTQRREAIVIRTGLVVCFPAAGRPAT
jgi:hypothetical protein